MAKAVALFTGGITELREVAIRADGQPFMRMQERHPKYGYKWSKWSKHGEKLGNNAIAAMDKYHLGFTELSRTTAANVYCGRFDASGNLKIRLPT